MLEFTRQAKKAFYNNIYLSANPPLITGIAGKIQMIKHLMLLLTVLVLLTTISAANASGNLEYTFHNKFYLRYSHGLSVYLKDPKNGYKGLSEESTQIGMTFEPEAGVYLKDKVQIGASYMYMDAKSEFDGLLGIFYDDAFFSGAAVKVRYFLLNRKSIKIPVGIEGIFGKCQMFSGRTDSDVKNRPLSDSYAENFAAYRCFEGNGYGAGLTGSFVYQPNRFISFGFDADFRIIKSELLNFEQGTNLALADLLLRPLLESAFAEYTEDVTLDFSSMNFSAHISFQY